MPTSDASWSGSLRLIGDLERPDHHYLLGGDQCYFLGEYTARTGWGFSVTNQHIANLKKNPRFRDTPQWAHKLRTIELIGRAIRANLKANVLPAITFVPIPPSKLPTRPEYDNRMTQVARAIGPNADVREMIVSTVDREPMHATQQRRDPGALRASLSLRPELLSPRRRMIVLIDDVPTTGCSFTVCKSMLTEQLPRIAVTGIFVA
jgi:predicted amidophosphoribosyltransferase